MYSGQLSIYVYGIINCCVTFGIYICKIDSLQIDFLTTSILVQESCIYARTRQRTIFKLYGFDFARNVTHTREYLRRGTRCGTMAIENCAFLALYGLETFFSREFAEGKSNLEEWENISVFCSYALNVIIISINKYRKRSLFESSCNELYGVNLFQETGGLDFDE